MKQPHPRPSILSRRRFLRGALTLGAGLAGLSFTSLRRGPGIAHAAADLVWGPYLQSSTPTSIVIAWATTTNPASEVLYRIGNGPETSVAASATHCVDPFNDSPAPPFDSFYIQSATLSGLTSGVTYTYRVLSGGTELGSGAFTPARAANQTVFTFAVIGDSGSGNIHQRGVASRLAELNPEFILHCGDIISYDPRQPTVYDEWNAKFFSIYAGLIDHIPVFPSVGNHDFQDYPLSAPVNDYTSYLSVFFLPENATQAADKELYYSFDYGDAHFVTLNVYQSFAAGSAQYTWLVQDLANTAQFWKIVWLQTGPYSSNAWSGGIPGGSEATANRNVREILVPIFQQYNVDIVFAGDQHIYERSVPWKKTNNPLDIGLPAAVNQGGIVYVITGGGGGPLGDVQNGVNRGPWSQAGAMVRAYHTTKITINGPVLIGEAYEEVGGSLTNPFDTFVIDRSYEAPSGLSGGSVSPTSGGAGITYRFQVKYTNGLGTAPTQAIVMLDDVAYTMALISGTPASGAIYRYDTTLSFGNHQFYFDFGPGLRFPASDSFSGPIVNDPPTTPIPVTPADQATDVPVDATFSWTSDDPNVSQGDVLTYDFYLSTSDLPLIPTASGLTSASYTPPEPLLSGTTYFWKVIVRDSFGVTADPATVWQFTTHEEPPPPPPPPTYTVALPFVKR